MANPLDIAVAGWFFTVMGWLLSPLFSLLWNKLFAYLASDTSRKLRELEILSIPSLKQMLRDVEQQRMERAAKDKKGSESDLATLKKIENDLKAARYEAEDILDLVDYYRIERKVLGDRSWVWVQRLLSAAGACITWCKGSWFLTRTETILRAAVLQCAKGLCWLCFTLCRSGEQEQIPISQRPSNPVVQRLRVWSQYFDIKALCLLIKRWIIKTHDSACFYRDWSYAVVGIKSNQKDDIAADSFLPVIEGRRLKKRIEQIENIISDSKKSDLLNEHSSSSKILVKDTNNKQRGSTQEEIKILHRSIKCEVFGRDKERERICNMLRKGSGACGSKPYCVIGIHGITGSGKSTLAQYVCDHEKKAKDEHFDLIMFSHVSMTFSVGKIFFDMLEQITHDQPSDTVGLKSLQQMLKIKLKGKRFLLVLDDLWVVNNENQEGLDILLDALNAGKSGSKILVTAQREDAAATLGCLQKQIAIPDLDDKDYLSLFMHHARPGAVNDDEKYRWTGKKIANKLRRSPIAAVTVGKQLQRNTRIDFWETTANDDVLNETMGALWWSYQQLGVDIKPCFAYCSTFPRGYMLKRDELVRIWIAQGFVNTMGDAKEELEDIGNHYFNELLTFSFLMQVQKTIFDTDNESFTIHDLLHELAERVAGRDFYKVDLNGSPKHIPPGVHHVSIETNNGAEIAESYLELEILRTLIIKAPCTVTDIMQPMEVMKRNHDLKIVFEHLFTRLRKLRVLIVVINLETDMSSVSVSVEDRMRQLYFPFPPSIGQMKHLRYLGFRYFTPIGRMHLALPSTFSKLYHMQTIEVHSEYCKVSCPEDMSNLIHLRHISGCSIFPNVGSLVSLQTMICFEVRKEQGYELKQLKHQNKLRSTLKILNLGIVGSKEEALEAQLAQKKLVTKLLLSFSDCQNRDPDIIAEVFEGLCPPEDLLELTIREYNCSSGYPSWMFSRQLPDAPKRLQKLVLYYCSPLGSIPVDSELFIHLLELCIEFCDWDSLPENMEHLVSLQNLEMLGCPNMELPLTLPQSLDRVSIVSCRKMELLPTLPRSLRNIRILKCRMLSTTCRKEGPEIWHKIPHIPEKDIYARKDEATVSEHSELFTRLLELHIDFCEWDSLPENMEHLVSLQTLIIRGCDKMKFLPTLPRSLQKIEILICGKLSTTCKEEGHENWHKIQHIPMKDIA